MKTICLCCGYKTIDNRGDYDICPVCFWEDERYMVLLPEGKLTTVFDKVDCDDDKLVEIIIDMESGANHGLTLREARANYLAFGACHKDMLKHCRKPKKSEMV